LVDKSARSDGQMAKQETPLKHWRRIDDAIHYEPDDAVILAIIVALATFGLSELAFLAIEKALQLSTFIGSSVHSLL
jgi:hypothetical protein